MDTITHGIVGALAARSTRSRLPVGRAVAMTAVASVFPDIDFIVAFVDPYAYLYWHRLLTHTFVLLPAWAVMLAAVAAAIDRHHRWLDYLQYAATGLVLHIVLDAFNIWPLKFLWPLSEISITWPVLFVIDLVYTGIAVAFLLLAWWQRSRRIAAAGLVLLAVYTAVQFPLNAAATEATSGIPGVRAYAQPYAPWHRKLVVTHDDGWSWAFLSQWGTPRGGYQAADELRWTRALHPEAAGDLVGWAWNHPRLARYRQFAAAPFLYGLEHEAGRVCVWFADARFVLPGMQPPFRYGLCGVPGDPAWTLERRGRW